MSILRMISQELEFDSEVRKIFGYLSGYLDLGLKLSAKDYN
jgi:hypothetical protein